MLSGILTKKQLFILLIILFFILPGCEKKQPIKVGFVGCLTGHLADIGIAGRNAVILAVDEINNNGGIKGRPVELIIRDDMNNPAKAVQVDNELIKLNVAAILGHMTSSMSMKALPVIQKNRIVMVSPTSTTNKLSQKDDFFFRITSSDKVQSDILAEYAYNKLGLRSISCIYDLSNKVFANGLQKNFQAAFEKMGGVQSYILTFTSGTKISYKNLAKKLIESKPDGILIIAGALNTAMICQQIRKINSEISLISSGWAGSSELIQYGGSAVEGIVFPQVFNKESKTSQYLEFKKKYMEQFGKEPNFASVCSYEAARFLFSAMSKAENLKNLKSQMLKQGIFQGLQGNIELDSYGDAKRSQFIITVNNGHFFILERK